MWNIYNMYYVDLKSTYLHICIYLCSWLHLESFSGNIKINQLLRPFQNRYLSLLTKSCCRAGLQGCSWGHCDSHKPHGTNKSWILGGGSDWHVHFLLISSTPSKPSMTDRYKSSRHLSVANTSRWIMKKLDKQKDVTCAKIRASQF